MGNSDAKFELTRKIILYSLPILALAGVTIPLMIGQSNLSVLGSYIAVPMFFAPIIYLKYSKNPIQSMHSGKSLFLLLLICYFLCLSISIILLYLFEVRPFAYFIIITLMGTTILLEILLFDVSQRKSIIILLQIMILALNIIWGVTLKYYFFVGGTDTFEHVRLIKSLIDYGYVTDIFKIYKPFPLWHILNYLLYEISNTFSSMQKMMFFTNGIIYSFFIPLIYLVALKIYANRNFALLASLFVCFFQGFIYYGMYSISRSVVSFLLILLMLLLLDLEHIKKTFLSILIIFSIILYHTASIPFIIGILILIYILKIFYNLKNNRKLITFNYLITIVTLTLAYWMNYADMLFKALITNLIMPLSSTVSTKFVMYSSFDKLFNYLHFSPLLFYIILGILFALSSKKFSEFEKVFFMIGLFLVPITLPGLFFLSSKLAFLNISRFEEYTILFICLTGAIGFLEIFYRSKKYLKVFLIFLFIIMIFLSISNDYTASDNPLLKKPAYTYYLTQEETTAFNTISNYSVDKGYLMGDYIAYMYLKSLNSTKSHPIEVDKNGTKFLINGPVDIILIRENELKKRPLAFYTSRTEEFELNPPINKESLIYYDSNLPLYISSNEMNKIYTSGAVFAFVWKY